MKRPTVGEVFVDVARRPGIIPILLESQKIVSSIDIAEVEHQICRCRAIYPDLGLASSLAQQWRSPGPQPLAEDLNPLARKDDGIHNPSAPRRC
jgi:hypothetical protein